MTSSTARKRKSVSLAFTSLIGLLLYVTTAGQAPTASTAGVVVTTGPTPQPVRGAIVLIGSGVPGVLTDDEGRFAFSRLQAGTYDLLVTKPAYLPAQYGATRLGGSGTPIKLSAGQRMTGLTVRLARGAVITGIVTDIDGQPAPNLSVSAAPAAPGLISNAAASITDDRGMYRIFGLPPGEFTVAAAPPRNLTSAASRPSVADMDAVLAQLRAGARGGQAQRATVAAAIAPSTSPTVSYAAVYYPGTTDQSQAVHVKLAEGEERVGVDFPLVLTGTTQIAGTAIGPDGRALFAVTVSATVAGSRTASGLSAQTGPDGKFRLLNVAPGHYTLRARDTAATLNPAGTAGLSRAQLLTAHLWAIVDVNVAGLTATNVTVVLRPSMTMSGRIVFDQHTLAPPGDLTQLGVRLVAVASPSDPAPNALPQSDLRANGTLTIAGIVPGRYQVTGTVPGAPATGWWLRSAIADGKDLLDSAFEFTTDGTGPKDVVLTFSDVHPRLSGTLTSAVGAPAPSYFVVVFPASRALWTTPSRRTLFTRPATDGAFAFTDLPPGEYLVAALTDLDPATWQDTDFLAQIVPAAIPVTLGEGEQKTQDLRIGR